MPAVINPTTVVKVVPRDGELEITLNIHITLEGKVIASSEDAEVQLLDPKSERKEEKVEPLIPTFKSGVKVLNFSKEP